jgi:aryl-alcohol dehydrogenase-like predicted oxidoreductase
MMTKRKLGLAGPEVSAIGFGCRGLTSPSPSTIFCASTRAGQIAVIRAAHDFGVSFFDAAADCGPHDGNETLLGEAIAPFRAQVAVATSSGLHGHSSRPAQIRQAAEATLRRLGTEAIDLFSLQRVDPQVPVEDVAGAVQELIREGKVKHFGLCAPSVASLRRAHAVQRVSVVQAAYSLWDRTVEEALLPTLEELGIGLIALSPLGGGALAEVPGDGTLAAVAERRHVTLPQLALAWLLAQKPWIVPVPGTRRLGHVDENLGGADVYLNADDLRQIDAALAAPGQMPEPELAVTAS